MSNRVAQVRPERSPETASRPSPAGRGRRKPGDPAGLPSGAGKAGDAAPETVDADLANDVLPDGGLSDGRLADGELAESSLAARHADASRPVVAVTGAAQGLGLALTRRLAQSPLVGRVVALDIHRGDVSGVTWRIVDVRDPALAGRLSDVDVVVHTDVDFSPDSDRRSRRAFNVRGAQTVLTAAAAGGVGRVVLVTSAMVYGARPDNPVPLPEDAPLSADSDDSVAGDLLEIEHLAERAPRAHQGLQVSVARPAALVGDGIDTLVTRHFEAPRLLAVKGCAARWQFCHVDDLVLALELAAAGKVTGEFAVGCDGWLEQDVLEDLAGLRRIELPGRADFRDCAAAASGRDNPGAGR